MHLQLLRRTREQNITRAAEIVWDGSLKSERRVLARHGGGVLGQRALQAMILLEMVEALVAVEHPPKGAAMTSCILEMLLAATKARAEGCVRTFAQIRGAA